MPCLAEVFSVRVFSKHGPISSDELYGNIVVDGSGGGTVFFKRTGGPSDDSILPDGSLSLTPDRCTRGDHWSIRLKLYHKKGQNNLVAVSLYGHIRAGNDFIKSRNPDEKYFQITMLSASKDKPCYTNGSHIPLSRCMTPVPLKRKLRIEAELFDPITNMIVAVGTASFVARPSGCQTQTIGCIQVKVTWTDGFLD